MKPNNQGKQKLQESSLLGQTHNFGKPMATRLPNPFGGNSHVNNNFPLSSVVKLVKPYFLQNCGGVNHSRTCSTLFCSQAFTLVVHIERQFSNFWTLLEAIQTLIFSKGFDYNEGPMSLIIVVKGQLNPNFCKSYLKLWFKIVMGWIIIHHSRTCSTLFPSQAFHTCGSHLMIVF
jgi:hypothetical protein